MANKHRKVWKVVSRKMNSGKQTWPYCRVESLIGRAQFSRADTDIIKSIHRCISLKMLQV
jgi:hypothetical protein